MSDRGSFVTEVIWCPRCLLAATIVLEPVTEHVTTHKKYSFISGLLRGVYSGEEIDVFAGEFIPKLEKVLCHKLRVAVLAEEGEKIFTVKPKGGEHGRNIRI